MAAWPHLHLASIKHPDPGFCWKRYLEAVRKDCAQEGIAHARHDVQRFLPLGEQEGLRSWTVAFFLYQLARPPA